MTLLSELHGLNPELSASSIMIDFEIASRNALQEVFPDAHDMWSVHNREKGLPRMNKHIEGWHRCIQSKAEANHPSIWHFLDVLRHGHRSMKSSSPRFEPTNQHHHNVAIQGCH